MDKIKLIFKNNIELLSNLDKIIYLFRIQNYDSALRISKGVLNLLGINIEEILNLKEYFNKEESIIDFDYINIMLTGFLDAQDNKDYILLADLYEAQLIPFLLQLQSLIIQREEYLIGSGTYEKNVKLIDIKDSGLKNELNQISDSSMIEHNGYLVEYTSSGLITIASNQNNKIHYLHSNNRVINEAFILAQSWYQEEKSEYIVYGFGLGYHIQELAKIDENIQIEVYESDIKIIQAAFMYNDLNYILKNSRINLIYDPDFSKLVQRLKYISEDLEFLIHYPSIRNIKNLMMKEKLENYFIQYSSIQNQSKLLNGNFRHNITNYTATIDSLKKDFSDKDLIIVAAGPSLDCNFLQLKDVRKDKIILATGTVFKKLIKAGITPDYVLVTDANERVYAQMNGMEDVDVKLIFLSTAYKGFAQKFKGNKYIAFQKGYPKAEEYAKHIGTTMIQTGGSVSTTAIDIGITFGCKRIIMIGLDLAYTGNFIHAEDTSRREMTVTDDLREVEDIHGQIIYTNRSLDMYRNWIENRIRDIKDIEFINATEGGANIRGMKNVTFKSIL